MAAGAGARRLVNSGPTAERIYDAVKQAIMTRVYRPGERLDPTVLAEELNASATPVREALDRLLGEDLVESRTSSGFFLPSLDEPGLKDMYAWSLELLTLALRSRTRKQNPAPVELATEAEGDRSLAERTDGLFVTIAARSSNREHARAVARLNARIHAVRTVEPLALAAEPDELDAIVRALNAADRASLQRRIAAYHRRRMRAAAALVRALYRAG